jgi:hypothetical protein
MKLIIQYSYEGFVNHFADYVREILDSDGDLNSVNITMVLGPNIIIIVSGYYSGKSVFNFTEILNNFLEEYNIYDHIFGDKKNKVKITNNLNINSIHTTSNWFTLHNTERPIYNKFQIETYESLPSGSLHNVMSSIECGGVNGQIYYPFTSDIITRLPNEVYQSEYPHGNSVGYREKLYSCEFIAHNLFRILRTDKLNILIHGNSFNETLDDTSIRITGNYKYSEKKIVSLVLDVLSDFDLMGSLNGYNINQDLIDPLGYKPWLEDYKVGELILF